MIRDSLGNCWYKVGLHIHTTLSDGHRTPEEAAQIYADAGFDAIAITDHWLYYPENKIGEMTIIAGCEYHVGGSDSAEGVMHIVGLGMRQNPCVPRDASRQEILDAINKNGGIAVLAHPAWSLNSVDDAKNLSGFTATEIYNSVSDVNQSSRPYSGYFVDLLANAGITYKLLATDDTHYYDGNDETKSFVMVKAESSDADDLIKAIKDGDFYASQGPELYVEKLGDKITARCSHCSKIMFLSNAVWAPDKIYRGENLTYAEYPIKPFEKWVRVEVVDDSGCFAWSNIINLK